jgi:hypothetical protein
MSPAAAFGDKGHKQLDSTYDGKPLPLDSADKETRLVAERAQPALQYIPRRDQVIDLYREQSDWLDTRVIVPEIEPLQIQVKKDLEYSFAAEGQKKWVCTDYKFVGSFDRMLTKAELRANVQGILYPADTMIRYQTPTLMGRWLYISTDLEKMPEARPVDIEFTYDETLRRAQPIIRIFDYMRHLVRLRVMPNDLPPNPDACLLYYSKKKGTGGCQYRPEIFGPCDYHGPKVPRFEKPDPTIATEIILAMTQPAPQLQALPPGWEWFHDVANNQYVPRQVQAVPAPPPPPPPISMPLNVPFAPPEASAFPVAAAPPAPTALPPPPPAPVASLPPVAQTAQPAEAGQPGKRKRRMKAEMEAARAAEAEIAAPPPPTQGYGAAPSAPVAVMPRVTETGAPAGYQLDETFDSYGEVVSVKYQRGGFVFEIPLPADAGDTLSQVVFQAVRKVLERVG